MQAAEGSRGRDGGLSQAYRGGFWSGKNELDDVRSVGVGVEVRRGLLVAGRVRSGAAERTGVDLRHARRLSPETRLGNK